MAEVLLIEVGVVRPPRSADLVPKLFNAMITPTFLYGSGTRTLTAERAPKIQTAQKANAEMDAWIW